MRLYLSSFRFGNKPEELVNLSGTGNNAAVIMNARDYQPEDHRNLRCREEVVVLKELGFNVTEIDLRDYFEKSNGLVSELKKYQLIWTSGGNVFLLRLAMKKSGFDKLLVQKLANDELVYAGYSAAGCVLAPSLDGYAITDDPTLTESIYGVKADYSGLGILHYYFEPHYQSSHPESKTVDEEISQLKLKGLPYKALHDGEVLVIDGNKECVIR